MTAEYLVIFIIISSHDQAVYADMKKLSKQYYSLYPDKTKYFYIEYKKEIDSDIVEIDDHIYIKGVETGLENHGIYIKTIKVIQYLSNKYEYSFIFRTNLSSFLHVDNICKYLETIPNKQQYAGGWIINDFISGTGIIMSKDVGDMVSQYQGVLPTPHDDVNIAYIIRHYGIKLQGYVYNAVNMLDNNSYDSNVNIPHDILYFRIKNVADRNIDIMYFKLLLKRIYNIDVSEAVKTQLL